MRTIARRGLEALPQAIQSRLLAIARAARGSENAAHGYEFAGVDPDYPVEGTHQGRLPIYARYRWSVKPGYRSFRPILELLILEQAGLLAPSEQQYLRSCIGSRTIERPLEDIEGFAAPIVKRHADHFVPDAATPMAKTAASGFSERIERARNHHRAGFRSAERLGFRAPAPGERALEVGFNEGYSPIALSLMGFESHAIDNGYGLAGRAPGQIAFVAKQCGATVHTAFGDVTTRTQYPDGHFRYVFSASVLEHILDLDSACVELRRVLHPDGIMVHSVGSYYCCDGAHALAIPDQPWGHVRMSATDYEEYVYRWRPHEAHATIPWLRTALARRPIAALSSSLARAGLKIHMWIETPSPAQHLRHLTPAIVGECLRENPGIALTDLVVRDVYFIATAA